ncbi:histidine phosphatase family protein [Cohnella sp. JJ-181]|uniref:histidine phosphatase family protein n=1 Tax=Cohnella rhizoplanae TaxID=2974897 RepID=UPI0022FF8228|nr:histidine phosphatase family protein [Cohnella sp. JJ-181]CAI6087335.1 hypothetical protein COHCIP112018_05457 [Cohnella sp. JJ-181]
MKTIIYMVRHGESPYNEGNKRTRGLTPKGKVDIKKVTRLLIEEGIDMVISSPYRRAILSVEGLAEHLKLDIQIFEDLKERHFASYMMDNSELMSGIRESFNDPDYTLPGGESNAECQNRAISVLNPILQEHRGQKIAIGTHGLVMTLMMNHFDPVFGLDFLNLLTKPDIYKMQFEGLELEEVTRMWKP